MRKSFVTYQALRSTNRIFQVTNFDEEPCEIVQFPNGEKNANSQELFFFYEKCFKTLWTWVTSEFADFNAANRNIIFNRRFVRLAKRIVNVRSKIRQFPNFEHSWIAQLSSCTDAIWIDRILVCSKSDDNLIIIYRWWCWCVNYVETQNDVILITCFWYRYWEGIDACFWYRCCEDIDNLILI